MGDVNFSAFVRRCRERRWKRDYHLKLIHHRFPGSGYAKLLRECTDPDTVMFLNEDKKIMKIFCFNLRGLQRWFPYSDIRTEEELSWRNLKGSTKSLLWSPIHMITSKNYDDWMEERHRNYEEHEEQEIVHLIL